MTTVEVDIRKDYYKIFQEIAEQKSEQNDVDISAEFIMKNALHEWIEKYKEGNKITSKDDVFEKPEYEIYCEKCETANFFYKDNSFPFVCDYCKTVLKQDKHSQ